MTELSFLIDLLLNHDLPKATKDLLAQRIKEVESNLVAPRQVAPMQSGRQIPALAQAPSTLAAMAKHGDLTYIPDSQEPAPIVPIEQVAQTPAAMAAISNRNEMISKAISGHKPPKHRNF